MSTVQAKYGGEWGEQHGSDGEEEKFKLHGANIIVVQVGAHAAHVQLLVFKHNSN